MKTHYRKFKGYRRHPGRGGRPVYYVEMTPEEFARRRSLICFICAVAAALGGGVLWLMSMI